MTKSGEGQLHREAMFSIKARQLGQEPRGMNSTVTATVTLGEQVDQTRLIGPAGVQSDLRLLVGSGEGAKRPVSSWLFFNVVASRWAHYDGLLSNSVTARVEQSP